MVRIARKCPFCGQEESVLVGAREYERYQAGAPVQVAFQNLSPEQRDVIITGVCSPCREGLDAAWERIDAALMKMNEEEETRIAEEAGEASFLREPPEPEDPEEEEAHEPMRSAHLSHEELQARLDMEYPF